REDARRGEEREPRLSRARFVGDRAEKGARRRDHEPRDRKRVAPPCLAADGIGRYGLREISREDEGRDDRGKAGVRPVEEAPGEERACGGSSALPLGRSRGRGRLTRGGHASASR